MRARSVSALVVSLARAKPREAPRKVCAAGARAIGGQLEREGRAGELVLPVGELLIERLAREPAALPRGEVGVLDRELGQRRGLAPAEGLVERAELAAHDPARQASETTWCIVNKRK